MKVEELVTFCEQNNVDIAEVGADHEKGAGYLLHWNNPNNLADGECLHVKAHRLESLTPAMLRKLVVNGRDVRHTTRIVGYFSHTQNWNRSKLGELKDRHKGNYSVPV